MSTSPLPPDPYAALGVDKDADENEIKKAHRKLVLKHHPDRIKDPALVEQGKNEFQKVQQAYELLTDPVKRQRYDDEVRLAQLRRERMMSERETPRGPTYTKTTYTARPSQAPPQPMPRESRPEPPRYVYEERTPEPYFEGLNGKMYEEPLPKGSVRKDPYEKRSSTGKPSERKEKPKSAWDRPVGPGISMRMAFGLKGAANKARSRTEEKEAHARNAKARDKEERKQRIEKEEQRSSYGRYASPRVDDFSESSESSSDDDSVIGSARRRAPPKQSPRAVPRERSPRPIPRERSPRPMARDRSPRAVPRERSPRLMARERSPQPRARRQLTPEPPRRREPSPRRFSVSDAEEYDSPDEWKDKHSSARDYIRTAQTESRRTHGRPPLTRQGSEHQYWTSPRDHRRSGSDSDKQQHSHGSSKASPRSVPPEDGEMPRRPQLHPHMSAPAGIRAAAAAARGVDREVPIPRARQGSFDARIHGHRQGLFGEQPELKRTTSDPVPPKAAARRDTAPPKPSTLKQTEINHDSGYGSSSNPHTPEMRGDSPAREARATTTKYRAKMDEDDAHHKARKMTEDGGDLRKFLSPKSAEPSHHTEERRERRSSQSRDPEPRSRSKKAAAVEGRPSLNRADSHLRHDESRSRARTVERSPERSSYMRSVDPSKARYASQGMPHFARYDDVYTRADPAIQRAPPPERRKASAY